jgi:hypothetical protein
MIVEVNRKPQHERLTYARAGATLSLGLLGSGSLAGQLETIVFERDTMMSEMRQSGSRTLPGELAAAVPCVEHAVTATGPSSPG